MFFISIFITRVKDGVSYHQHSMFCVHYPPDESNSTLLRESHVYDPSTQPYKDVDYIIMGVRLRVVGPQTRLLCSMCSD